MMPTRPIRAVRTIVRNIIDLGTIRVLALSDPDGWELPPAVPGSHIDLYLGEDLTRTYSLCGDPAMRSEYMIAVKHERAGRGGSEYIHSSLQVGDSVDVSLPRNTFPAVRAGQSYTLVAGGVGVTPFISIMYELERIRAPYQLHVFYRHSAPLIHILRQFGRSGTIVFHDRASDPTAIRDVLQEYCDNAHAFCCGPSAMMADFDAAVQHWNPANVGREFFTPPKPVLADKAYSLQLKKSGRSISVPVGTTALNALEAAGVAMHSSCQGGICGACKVAWLEGEPEHRDLCLSDADKRRYFMPCVSTCKSEVLVLDL